MRFATIVLAVTLCGCSTERTVTAPTPAAPAPAPAPTPAPTPPPAGSGGFLLGMVISSGGGCIQGAVVEIVGGQGIGRRMTQTALCSWWDPDEGFIFTDLVPDMELTIRASATGYTSKESTVKPSLTRNGYDLSNLAVVVLNQTADQ